MSEPVVHSGSCLCGLVTFEVSTTLPAPDACHCVQCRKWSGNFGVSTDVPRAALTVKGDAHVTWFNSSEKVRRGFCAKCGSSLFFDPRDQVKHQWIGVSMGAFDAPTHTKIALHIFVREKGDYYTIDDGAPQHLDPPSHG